jgi:hypothetical protein
MRVGLAHARHDGVVGHGRDGEQAATKEDENFHETDLFFNGLIPLSS